MEIIPAIDIKNGRCVRLFQGNFSRETIYDDNPLAAARRWVEQGATRLHIVDLDGARSGQPTHLDVIGAILRAVPIPVQVGGGLRSEADVEQILQLGADRVVIGTAAVRNPDMVTRLVERFGHRIIVGVDARDGLVATEGWVETAEIHAVELVDKMAAAGVRRVICTDISRDGTLSEPNYAATAAMIKLGGPAVIASGGVASLSHILRLAEIGCEGVIVGRALYTNAFRLSEAIRSLSAMEAA
jgi:phosphoribosylformimino-5-aminoimidazole carboxamide ribotide isomerase